jgi:exodeoxyribonuclease V alpha subunit
VDAIAHGIPRAHLSRNYRQAGQQGILHMAEGILHRQRATPAECVEMHLGVDGTNIDALFDDLIRQHGGRDYEAWQVITYQNENAERYNLRAQAIINPDGRPLFEYPLWKLGTGERGRPKYHAEVREGDKVIVVKNNSTLEIFNGQTGRVVGLTNKTKVVQRKNSVTGRWEEQQGEFMPHLIVEITGRDVAIPEDELEKHIQLGYVITVNKAQGSDWNRVLVMQPGKVRDDTAGSSSTRP